MRDLGLGLKAFLGNMWVQSLGLLCGLTLAVVMSSKAFLNAEINTQQTPLTPCEMALVAFYNPVCRHCQLMEPVVTKLMTQYGQTFRLNMQNVAVETASRWADFLGVEGTPTYYLYPAGVTPKGTLEEARPIGVVVGRDPQGLETMLKQAQKTLWQAHPQCKVTPS
jgi:hypothetical protein